MKTECGVFETSIYNGPIEHLLYKGQNLFAQKLPTFKPGRKAVLTEHDARLAVERQLQRGRVDRSAEVPEVIERQAHGRPQRGRCRAANQQQR